MPITVEYLRRFGPDAPLMTLVTQYYDQIPFSIVDANGDGVIDSIETRAAARLIKDMTPIETTTFPAEDRLSYKLKTMVGLKDQFTDQFTLSLEREIIKDFSVSATFIYKHSAGLFANIPVLRNNGVGAGTGLAGEEWQYDRVPFTDLDGNTVELYSIKWLDYDGNGVVDAEDIRWIGNNSDFKVTNMAPFDGVKPKRDFQGYQLVFNKRFSNRWQILGSFLFTPFERHGQPHLLPGHELRRPDGHGQQLDELVELHDQQPDRPPALHAQVRVQGVGVLYHPRHRRRSRRPLQDALGSPGLAARRRHPRCILPTMILRAASSASASGPSSGREQPDYLPTQTIVDFRVEKPIRLAKYGSIHLILDVFNLFNSNTPTSIDYQFEFGKVGGIISPRTFRLSLMYQF